MLLLTSTSDKIQLITSSTANIDVHASYVDYDGTDVTTGRDNTKVVTATTTDIVGSPAPSTTRNVKTLHIGNVHASASNLVEIVHTDGTDAIKLESVTLLAGERIAYVEGQGFEVVDASGITKTNPAAGVFAQRLATTQSNSTTTATEVTGLSMATTVGTFIFEYFLRFQSATATVGPKLSVNYDGTVTSFMATLQVLNSTTTDSIGVMDQDATVGQVMSGMAQRAKSTAGGMIWSAAAGGVDTVNSDILIIISGLAVVTVAGNFELWHGSETATSTSIMADSVLRLTKVG